MRNNMPPKEHKINLPDGFGTLTIYNYSRTLEDMKNEYEAKEPYIPRIGDTVQLQGKIREIHNFNFCTVEVQEKYELVLKASSLTLISRASRTLTKAEAEKMLSEKLGEEVSIE